MIDPKTQEIKAASEYCNEKIHELCEIYDQVFAAFLAGIEWQKKRPPIKPEKEYYGG